LKITAKIRLLPTPEQAAALDETLTRANQCANWLSSKAWELKIFSYFSLQKLLYHEARKKFGLSAQLTIRVFSKVADAYKLDNKRERFFRLNGSIAYDDRILRFRDGVVSIWTLQGRQTIPFVTGLRQKSLLASRQGESDLILHRRKFYLGVTCNVVEPDISEVDDWLGLDMGIANIATDSDGGNYSGSTVKSVRHRHRRLRSKLQANGSRRCRRKLKTLSGCERRFASNTNHIISKQIVECAKGTRRGIAIEDLAGISKRITVRRSQRAILHSWAFFQLRQFIEYKARLAGVPVVTVDARNTSRECSRVSMSIRRIALLSLSFGASRAVTRLMPISTLPLTFGEGPVPIGQTSRNLPQRQANAIGGCRVVKITNRFVQFDPIRDLGAGPAMLIVEVVD